MAAELLFALALVAANGFFVAAEFAIARLRPTQVAQFVRQGKPGARSAQHAVDHIDAYLSACQLGITLASLGLGAVGEPVFHDLLEPLLGDSASIVGFGLASAIAFLIITVLHVVLGELAPKSAAIARTGPMALILSPPMRAFYLSTKPVVDVFNWLGNLVLKPFGIPPASEAGHAPHSEDELRDLLRESREGGLIERDEQQLSEAALVFGDRRAREIMTPRSEIDFAMTDNDPREIARTAMAGGHTRLPLCEAGHGLEDAVGFIHTKDLLPISFGQAEPDVRSLARPLARVAESTRLDEVLREMRRDRRHLALVLDEHGTVVGLVTLLGAAAMAGLRVFGGSWRRVEEPVAVAGGSDRGRPVCLARQLRAAGGVGRRAGALQERPDHVQREREHDRRVLVRPDLGQRLQVA
jgi:CBS domain containing-hemolysin-like protein